MNFPTSRPSGALATGSTTTLRSGHSFLCSIQATTDGTNDAVVTVYDNTAASGTVVAVLTVPGATKHGSIIFNYLPRADLGLTVTVAGTGATAYVTYQ